MTRNASCACLAAWLSFVSASALAQAPAPPPGSLSADPPAHVAVVDGRVSLERNGRPELSPLSTPLLSGDRLRTEDGRVEVLFADGAALHLDASSTLDFQSDEVIRLLTGRVRLIIPGPRRELSYRIDAPGGWVQIAEPGEYRVAASGGERAEVELVVLRGSAQLMNDDGRTSVRAGERALARAGEAPSYAYVYNSAAWDSFDRWSESRRSDRSGASAQYLPETVQAYSSTFDQYGSWRDDETYGHVWYPTVSVGWRPYFHGRWASYPSYGWTWIGTDAWAWPTHHYGRWGFSAGAWFWIPGRTWGPAWVSWAYAPGYTTWCPLGWDNRAVLQFGHGYYGGRYDHWNGWTVVPNGRFGAGYVNVGYLGGGRIDVRTREAFVVRAGAPPSRGGYAVPRNAAPIRVAGSGRPGGYSVGVGRLTSPGIERGRAGDGRLGLATRGPVGAAGPSGPAADGRGARAAVRGDARTETTGRASRAPAGADGGARAAAPEVIRGGVRADETAAFRDRRPLTGSAGAGYPAPSRAPRDSTEVVQRMGVPRERTAAPRAFDPSSIPVYRGGVPRTPDQPSDRRAGDLYAPGATLYRSNPAAPASSNAQAAPRTWSTVDRRQAPSPGYQPSQPAERGGQIDRTPSLNRATPRESQPPAPPVRSYGGEERRPSPGPTAAPSRDSGGGGGGGGAPRGPGASPGGSQSQGAPDRGSAVRRGRGE